MRYILFLSLILMVSVFSTAENTNIDSLYLQGDFVNCSKQIMKEFENDDITIERLYKNYYYLTEIERTNENFEKALEYNAYAKQYIQNTTNEIQNLNRRGAIYYQWSHFEKKQGDSAFYYLEKSSQLSLENNHTEFYINNLNLIATLWNNNRNDPHKSLSLFEKALQYAQEEKDDDLLIQINTNITMPLVELGQYEKAKSHLLSIEKTIDKLNIPIYKLNFHQKLSTIYHHLNDFENEAKILKKEVIFINKFFDSEKIRHTTDIEEKYKTKLKDLENQKLVSEGEKKTNVILIIISALLLSIFGMFLYIRLSYKVKDANTNLQKSIQLNKRIFSILAHDLKQPIVSLEAMLFLLDQDILDAQQKDKNRTLIKNHLKATSLFMDDMMTWAKLEVNKTKLPIEKVNIWNIIQEIIVLYSKEIKEKDLNISIEMDSDLVVENSKMMNFIILKNLINNAIKFSFDQTNIKITHQYKEGSSIFSVINTGQPIPTEIRNNLFDYEKPFQYYSKNNSAIGFGLGLSIVSKLISDYNGKIWIDNANNPETTKISFYL